MARRGKTTELDGFRSPIHGIAPKLTPPSASWLLLWATVAFVGMFVAAGVLELDEVVTVPARIEPSGQVRHVQHFEGGTIREVLVHEGAFVGIGDVLVRLVNSQGAGDLADKRARWAAFQARSARLKADLDGVRDIAWPKGIEIDAETKRRETSIHAERLSHRLQQVAVIQREIERRQREVVEIETKSTGLTRAQAKGVEEMKIKKKAYDAGVVGNQEIIKLEREQLMLDTEVSTSRDTIARLRAQQREADAKLSEFEKGWRTGVLDDIGKVEAEIAALKATMEVASDRESRSEVRSPVRGVVKMSAITSVGQVARPGDTLMDIVPLDDALVVEAKVPPQDIGQLREGLPASIRLSAYDQFRYGHLSGRVMMVGADSIEETKGATQTTYYKVLIHSDKSVLTDSKGGEFPVRSGMAGTASIVIGRKSILRMVFDPLLRNEMIFSLNSFKVVFPGGRSLTPTGRSAPQE
ncbi:HlyD family type I secretion periplasmic adaptor subunit [Paramagnetospirillum kuznetsovii]|uniref:Membrane fusion protein (MFP) family protein n=1 Tax=Paramagnetospirillum kuznetsovii TaxID=2053833 RepID=A0A364NU75_9PROT|nr:HlyD family type I secretion periplasmic adaptor subunit [Paramagnetospirillum kuznetsovii]RAU20612.1 HlyD family type I secretion periplasmic adaptor subunit [Paramagnetospirillum kuznetsovii]